MIKAYHQVGDGEWEDEDLRKALLEVIESGWIEPASMRVSRDEMEIECFKNTDVSIEGRFPKATGNVLEALEELARERISRLPRDGSRKTLFNCVDLIAGDIDRIFLRPGQWYSLSNGFVFDAEELIRKGARFRASDMLGYYSELIQNIGSRTYKTKANAKKAIVRAMEALQRDVEHRGNDGLYMLHWYLEEEGGLPDLAEIVWPGSLPVSLAIEAWNGDERLF